MCLELGCFSKSVSVAVVWFHVIISLSPSFLSVSLISVPHSLYLPCQCSKQTGTVSAKNRILPLLQTPRGIYSRGIQLHTAVDAFVTETRMESRDKRIFQGPTKGSTWLPHSKINLSRHGYLLPFEPLQLHNFWTIKYMCFNKVTTCTFVIVHC